MTWLRRALGAIALAGCGAVIACVDLFHRTDFETLCNREPTNAACGGGSAARAQVEGSKDAGPRDADAKDAFGDADPKDASDDADLPDASHDAGVCADTTSDPLHCGACGYRCVNGRSCVSSRCTPAWQPMTTVGAPTPRARAAAAALAGKFVVVGGAPSPQGVAMSTGGSYDPVSDSWSTVAALNQARCAHAAASSGTKIYVFGGLTDCAYGSTIGPGLEAFDGTNWTTISAQGAPDGRYDMPLLWTGSQLFVFGGGGFVPATSTGARFTPAGLTWTEASCSLSACERSGNFAAFADGNFARIWGGGPYGGAPAGLQYDLSSGVWSAWTLPPNTPPLPGFYSDDGRRIYFLRQTSSTCGSVVEVLTYDRKSNSWLAPDSSPAPNGLLSVAAMAWVGAELIAWSGDCGAGPTTVGGRYQPPAPP